MRLYSRKGRLAGLVAATAVAALAVTGCSANAGGSASGSKSLEVFSFWTSGSENAALTALFDNYKKAHPGVTVTNGAVAGGGGSNGTQVLQSRIAGNDAPPTWQSFPGKSLATYVKGNLVEDLTPLYKQLGLTSSNVPQSLLDLVTVNGKQYSMITGSHRVNVLWINKAVESKLGIDISGKLTDTDFMSDLAKAKAAGVDGLCLGDKDIFASALVVESSILAQLGPDDAKKLYAGGLSWSDPRIGKALSNFASVLGYTNSNHSALSWDQAVGQFAKGQCLFNVFADSAYGELTKLNLKDGTDFSYVPYPGTDGTFLDVSDSFVVSAKAGASQKNAEDWIKVIGSKEGQLAFNKLKGSTPMRNDVDVSSLGAYQQAAAKSFRSDAIVGTATFGLTVAPAVQQAFYDATTRYINDKDAAAFSAAMDKAAKAN